MAKKDKKINYKGNVKEYLSLAKKHKTLLIFLILGVIIAQALSLGDKFVFKYFIDNATLWTTGGMEIQILSTVFITALYFYIAVFLSRTLVEWLNVSNIIRYETRISQDLKNKYFSHIVTLDHEFHTTHKTGALISRLNRANGAVENFTDTILFSLSPLIIQLIILIPIFISFGKYQSIFLGLTCLTYILFSFILNKRMQIDNAIENSFHDKEKGFIADIFTNIDSVRFFGKENLIKKRFLLLTNQTKKKQVKASNWWRWMISGQLLILGIGTVLLFGVSALELKSGLLTLGELTFIYTTYLSILGPLNWFNHGLRQISRSLTDMQDLFEYGAIKSKIVDKPNAKDLIIKQGEVKFEEVNFGYTKKLFNNFNLEIGKNKKVALVGHSGCGKSSLIKLLYRMYDLDSGKITIDGQNIAEVKQESLRSEMAIVPQEPILFDDTIYNNILFARPNANREEVLKAIKFAQLDKVIKDFPKKENTIVGERGVKLSGGEKQRVSIARAILADKKVLVLDEATSALDSETEHEIQRDLAKLMEGRTSIIIAHRLSTIMHADKIVVLDKGKIVQIGTHRQLINQNGQYKKLWNLQKGGYIKE